MLGKQTLSQSRIHIPNLHPLKFTLLHFIALFAFLTLFACKKEELVLNGNVAQSSRVSDAALEQYIFRTYVDLLGEAPSESELADWSSQLRTRDLDPEARVDFIQTLQSGTDRDRYVLNLYAAGKERFLENIDDAEIQRRFIGLGNADDDLRLRRILSWQRDYKAGTANVLDLQRLGIHNLVYDEINMGSFNMVRASFDNLLWRYPTTVEFDAGFAMIENGSIQELFGFSGSDKDTYVQIISESQEALQGTVIWQYDQLLARRPTALETLSHLESLRATGSVEALQQAVMQMDEYAGF